MDVHVQVDGGREKGRDRDEDDPDTEDKDEDEDGESTGSACVDNERWDYTDSTTREDWSHIPSVDKTRPWDYVVKSPEDTQVCWVRC